MPHRFSVKDIALQAGLGPATVDRVLNARGGVRRQTEDRVRHAIRELDAQAGQLALSGAKLIVDVVAEAPQGFLDALEAALAGELPLMTTAVFRTRADMRTRFAEADMVQVMERIARRGSHGVILMAPDRPGIAAAVDRLEARGIPVVTLASDMGGTRRRGYVGLDNGRAGATAAWFMGIGVRGAARIVVTLRNPGFRGEQERLAGFRAALPGYLPRAKVEVVEEGRDKAAFDRALEGAARAGVDAVYSIGGGNRHLLGLLGPDRPLLVAHDLEPENLSLIEEGRIDLLIYHDFREDIRSACRLVLAAQARRPEPAPPQAALRLLVPPMVGMQNGLPSVTEGG
ncbi:MAG: LacI family DNA-binding transcriptional regulator [Jannaschia sp.]